MANHKSAKKRTRSDIVKNQRNRQNMSTVRTSVKAFRSAALEFATGAGDKENLTKLYRNTQSVVSKAVHKGIVHKNTASRTVARLTKTFKLIVDAKSNEEAATAIKALIPKKKTVKKKTSK